MPADITSTDFCYTHGGGLTRRSGSLQPDGPNQEARAASILDSIALLCREIE